MKYLISIILLFFTTLLFGQENSSLTILCPENWTISLNGYVQNGIGPKRVLLFNYPDGKVGETTVMAFVDGEDIILYNQKITLTGGKNTTIDIRPKKENEQKKDDKRKPNFGIFGKSPENPQRPIAKPDFTSIMNKVENTREKRFSIQPHKLDSIGSTPISGTYYSVENCRT